MTAPDDDMRWQVTAATTRCCMHVQLSRHLHQKYGDRLSLASTSHRWIKDRPVDPMMLGHANCNIGRKGHVLNMRIARHHTMSMHVRCDDVNYVELCSRGDNKYTMDYKQTLIFHVNFKILFSYWWSSTWYIFLEYIYFFFSDREIWKSSVYLTGLQNCLVRHEG